MLSTTVLLSQNKYYSTTGVISHRGAWKEFNNPENSRASFNQALALGCKGTEIDVWMSSDSVLVVNHDPHYKGLLIEKTTYKELKKHKLSNGETLSILSDYINKIRKQDRTTLIIDVKSSKISPANTKILARKCVETVRKYKTEDKVEYLFFDYEAGKYLITLEPTAKVSLLGWKTISSAELNLTAAQVKADGFHGLDLNRLAYLENPKFIEEAKILGLVLNVWTVNEREDMQWFIERGFHYITTDYPQLLQSVIASNL